MTFERKVTAVRFEPGELKVLANVFELARVKIQDVRREKASGMPERIPMPDRVASGCGITKDELFRVEGLMQEFFDRAGEV